MTLAENVANWTREWKAAEAAGKWEEWATSHPRQYAVLARIMLEVQNDNG